MNVRIRGDGDDGLQALLLCLAEVAGRGGGAALPGWLVRSRTACMSGKTSARSASARALWSASAACRVSPAWGDAARGVRGGMGMD